MLISAVGSAFNEERTAALTIHSLVPLVDEIILVDNGCTDNTIKEATEQARREGVTLKVVDGYDCYFLHDARHKGFKEAQGEWILVYDLDHYFNFRNPEWGKLLERLRRSGKAEFFQIAPSSLIGDLFHRHQGYPYMAPHRFVFRNTDKIGLPDIWREGDWPILPESTYSRASDWMRWAFKNMIWNLKTFEKPYDLALGRLALAHKCDSESYFLAMSQPRNSSSPNPPRLVQVAEAREQGRLSNPGQIRKWILDYARANAVLKPFAKAAPSSPKRKFPPIPDELNDLRWGRGGEWYHHFLTLQGLEWVYGRETREIIGRWPDLLPDGMKVWGGNREAIRNNPDWVLTSDIRRDFG